MTKAEYAMLERLFTAEVNGALAGETHMRIVQADNKAIRSLAAMGYAERITHNLGGRFPMSISGYVLTLLGHATYCMTVGDEEAGPDRSDPAE